MTPVSISVCDFVEEQKVMFVNGRNRTMRKSVGPEDIVEADRRNLIVERDERGIAWIEVL